ncbi:MAG: helix-turn-helix transcriptional regulator [Mailhella sp.]|nr:helix-turn-helix transcriptional regulator [Mailhella sp.]
MRRTSRLGALLREKRKEKKLSIAQLSKKSGLSTGYISGLERGRHVGALYSLHIMASTLEADPLPVILNAYYDVSGQELACPNANHEPKENNHEETLGRH